MADEQTTGRPLSDRETNDLVGKIQSVLTPDLLEPKYRKQSEGQHPTFGHCASATQAAYYMLGGKKSGYVPQVAKEDDGTTHWWLRHRQTGHVIDPTKEQYTSQGEKPPYDLGRGCGFPNPNPDAPSRRGQEIIDRISGKPFRQAKASGGSAKPYQSPEYSGAHTAPTPDSGSPMHDVTQNTYPDDFYGPNGIRYYGSGDDKIDAESYWQIQSAKARPYAKVDIYRAVPKNIKSINEGDWVTINRRYAREHGESTLLGDYKILKKTVRARDLHTNGDSFHEWGYWPKKIPVKWSDRYAETDKVREKFGMEPITRQYSTEPSKASGGPVEDQDIASPAPAEDEGITAYHGSPYEFERFDTSKIGTGIGRQRYGHGIYFAENEPTAKMYREGLTPESKGSMYEVRIKAHPDHFLDWDKPLSDQSEFVKNALNGFSAEQFGSNIYESSLLVPGKYRDKHAASKALLDRGIIGIKYLDANSRSSGNGTHNYVVFDDKLLDIKRRYEMGGAVPMASGGEAGDTQSMPQLTSEQQSLLDQLSRAIDRVYPAMDAAEARQPVIRHEPTMPGEPALTTEQHQEYNIGQLQNALARVPTDYPTGPVGYAEGGSLRKGISDWKWKPLSRVRESIGVSEIPSHVQDFGKFMDETANKASGEGLSVRDLIKAYTITRSSIRRAARKADTVRNAGLNIPDSITGMVRPEGAFGHWLHTSYGQNYLNDAEKGRVNEDAIKDAVRIMRPFGGQNQLVDALTWAVNNLPGQEKKFSELVSRAQQMQSSPSEWRELVKPIKGIRESKAGFMASMIGRGDQPTLDARQIVLHTGRPSDEASKYLSRSGAGASAVDRLARRQKALDLTIPQNLSPYYQHLAHHTIWDKVGNETTTHQDVIDAMRGAASGGAISSSILSHPVASAMRALGFKGIDGEESNLKKNESGVVSRALMLTSKKA